MFREFLMPVYTRIRAQEGPVVGFHTCGNMQAVVGDLLAVFPELKRLDVSGWNDVGALDRYVPRDLPFGVSVLNTVSLGISEAEQCGVLDAIAAAGEHRRVSMCAQAVVKRCPTYEETLERLNRFIARAYERFGA